ncbi:hypothetical protein VNO78_07713 [Psophocarpus tetragonolobus]|uniref:Uncharacterized protein n=1 Tax=Psophocarpus tetragonolobus TaxID=3891 RepID=A0AAN9SVU1_PSOTE
MSVGACVVRESLPSLVQVGCANYIGDPFVLPLAWPITFVNVRTTRNLSLPKAWYVPTHKGFPFELPLTRPIMSISIGFDVMLLLGFKIDGLAISSISKLETMEQLYHDRASHHRDAIEDIGIDIANGLHACIKQMILRHPMNMLMNTFQTILTRHKLFTLELAVKKE